MWTNAKKIKEIAGTVATTQGVVIFVPVILGIFSIQTTRPA